MAEPRTAGPATEAPVTATAVQEMVRGWDRAFRLHLLYQGSNPAVERFVEILRRQTAALWEGIPELTIGVEENGLRWGELPVYAAESGTDNLAFLLFRDGIREITLLPGFEEKDLDAWVALLARVHRMRGEEEDLLTLLWEGEWRSLRYRYVDPSADGARLPLASGAPPASVQPPSRGEAGSPTPGTVHPDDFQGALFFLDDSEMRGIAAELQGEMERDLTEGVLSALLDRFGDGVPDRQTAILGILADLLPVMLGAGHFGHALTLLEELQRAAIPSPAVAAGVQALFAGLALPETLAELLRVAEEVPEVGSSEDLPRLLAFLPPGALASLLRLAQGTQVPPVRAAFGAAADRIAEQRPDAVRPLLADADPALAAGAAQLAGRLGRAELAEPLVRLLERPEIAVRLAAVEALQQLRAPLGAGALERSLGDAEREVRIAAARALGELRYTPARRSLERALDSKRLQGADLTERIAFHEAYGSVADPNAVRRLDRTLNGRDWLGRREDAETRACAALALGRAGTPEARRALAAASADSDPVVRSAVGRAIRAGVS